MPAQTRLATNTPVTPTSRASSLQTNGHWCLCKSNRTPSSPTRRSTSPISQRSRIRKQRSRPRSSSRSPSQDPQTASDSESDNAFDQAMATLQTQMSQLYHELETLLNQRRRRLNSIHHRRRHDHHRRRATSTPVIAPETTPIPPTSSSTPPPPPTLHHPRPIRLILHPPHQRLRLSMPSPTPSPEPEPDFEEYRSWDAPPPTTDEDAPPMYTPTPRTEDGERTCSARGLRYVFLGNKPVGGPG